MSAVAATAMAVENLDLEALAAADAFPHEGDDRGIGVFALQE